MKAQNIPKRPKLSKYLRKQERTKIALKSSKMYNFVKNKKFWPTVRRINEVHGDRNLICSCASIEEYEEKRELIGS